MSGSGPGRISFIDIGGEVCATEGAPAQLVPMQHPEPLSEPFPTKVASKSAREMHRELRAYQRRLGTTAEEEGDFERVLHLAHELNNQITAAYLREAAESLPELSPILTAVGKRMLGR